MTDCGCTNFPASLGNVTFGANVGIGVTDPTAPLVVQGAGTGLLGAPGTVADHAGTSTDRVRLALGNLNAGTAPGSTSRSSELLFYAYNPAGTTLQATFEVATDAEQNGTQSFFVYDTVARAFRLYLGPTGNFGVGTATPGAKLVVAGLGNSQVEQGTTTTAADLFGATTDRTRLAVGNTNAGTGQGATSRSAELQFYGYNPAGTALQPMFELGTDAEKTGTQSLYIYDDVAKAYRLYLGPTGNLGIGTVSPQQQLHVVAAGSGATLLLESTTAGATDTALAIKSPDREWKLGQDVGGVGVGTFNLWDITAGASRLVVDTAGNVGIGTNSPGYPLDVNGTVRCTGVLLGGNMNLAGAIYDSTGKDKRVDYQGCYYA